MTTKYDCKHDSNEDGLWEGSSHGIANMKMKILSIIPGESERKRPRPSGSRSVERIGPIVPYYPQNGKRRKLILASQNFFTSHYQIFSPSTFSPITHNIQDTQEHSPTVIRSTLLFERFGI